MVEVPVFFLLITLEQASCSDEGHSSHIKARPLGVQRRRVGGLLK